MRRTHGAVASSRVQRTAAPAATLCPLTTREPPSKVTIARQAVLSGSTSRVVRQGTVTSSPA
eukprot:9983141-Lingulodinium_polyedra.AAC.1